MRISELTALTSEKFGVEVTNKEVIDFLKENGFKVSSHMNNVEDEMLKAMEDFTPKSKKKIDLTDYIEEAPQKPTIDGDEELANKKFADTDMIPCHSVVPYKLIAVGADRSTIYNWEYFGDVDYISYKDLRHMRRSEYITKPLIIIDDPAICYQWKRELGNVYSYYMGVEYPEEFFDLDDTKFKSMLSRCPEALKDVLRVTAISMIKNQNYPTVQKLTIMDSVLGTCLKEML